MAKTLEKKHQDIPVNAIFARHETFHPRYGWLKKGYDMASQDPELFTKENAPMLLGVGKNMVKAIRYWCNSFKVLKNDQPTEFGQKVLNYDGYDPYLENPASLWLLHWHLLKPTCDAAAWYYTFNLFPRAEFDSEDLTEGLHFYQETFGKSTAKNSLKKDIACILRMYVQPQITQGIIEDFLDCPFSDLGLIKPTGEPKRYRFHFGAKAGLAPEIIVFACLDYASWANYGSKTLSLSRLLYDVGSPGRVFKLTEKSLTNAIERLAEQTQKVALSNTGGLIQMSFQDEPLSLADNIIDSFYSLTYY